MHHALKPLLPPASVREARRQLNTCGAVSPELVGPVLARSWQRSTQAGLSPQGRPPGSPHASAPQLARALEQQRELVAHAKPVMEFLHEQTRDTDAMVILADADGMLLHALGDAEFLQRAERVALRPGATWHERWRGTNAIGTALQEDQSLVVHGAEHFLERNGFLTCAAAPIHDPSGRVLGALDLSGDHRGYHRHTLGLVRSAVRMIEHRFFDTRHAESLRLRLHTHAEGIGTLTECLLALSEDGWILGANEAALGLLGLQWADVGATQIQQVLDVSWRQLLDGAMRPMSPPRPAHNRRGQGLWLKAEPGRGGLSVGGSFSGSFSGSRAQPVMASGSAPAGLSQGADASNRPYGASQQASKQEDKSGSRPFPADALAALDTGDTALRQALDRARRVLDKPIALLLHGESGVGKEVFARAVHASGPRRQGPLVAVNCAALPESLIEAELFGYRPGAFTGASRDGAPGRIREAHGGTLFLDEIGDMPLAMQGRLLRVLQERQVLPLGGGKPVAVDIQLICATHRKLKEEMLAGRFREDLYYRLNGLTLHLPALRDRQDLPALIERLLRDICPEREVSLSLELARHVAAYRWPGNLRQLANALRTACALMEPGEWQIDWAHLPDDLAEDLRRCALPTQAKASGANGPSGNAFSDEPTHLRSVEARMIEQAVADSAGNLSEAARRLGISRNTLYRKLEELGLHTRGGR